MKSCLIELGNNIFNFEPLTVKDKDYEATKVFDAKTGSNFTIYFNLCEPTNHKCPDKNTQDFANSVNENNTCSHLSGGSTSDQTVSLQDQRYPEYGVNMQFVNGNACTDGRDFKLDL